MHLQTKTEHPLKTDEKDDSLEETCVLDMEVPVASKAFMICLSEKPISNSGTAMAGGGGDVERRLVGSDNA